jgi:type VI secretion system protein ImpM
VEPTPLTAYVAADIPAESYSLQVDMEFEEQSTASAYPCMLDALLSKLLGSYSLWSTTGSERVAPCVFNVQGLPALDKMPAMLDGQWRQWGWVQPYTLQT